MRRMSLEAAMLLQQLGNLIAEFLDAVVASQAVAVDHEGDDGDKGAVGVEAPP